MHAITTLMLRRFDFRKKIYMLNTCIYVSCMHKTSMPIPFIKEGKVNLNLNMNQYSLWSLDISWLLLGHYCPDR